MKGVLEFSGMKIMDDVEFAEIPGVTFQGIMKLLLVTLTDTTNYVNQCHLGKFATGTIVRNYDTGSWVPVIVDITTNHGGYFIFKLCPNNDISQDPDQRCFDQHILQVSTQDLVHRVRDQLFV